jgi:putative membrane protein
MKALLPALLLSAGFACSALAQGAAPSTDDFVTKAAAGGLAEVQAGQIAERKGTARAVKDFGRRMVRDHTKANADLKRVLAKEGKQSPPDSLDNDGQDMKQKLDSASSAAFDKTYVDAMVNDHDTDVQEFTAYAKSGDDKAVKDFAKRTLPVIKHHDAMAHAIQKRMGKAASR